MLCQQQICRLCHQSVDQNNVQVIDEVVEEILGVLLIDLDLTLTDSPVVCKTCSKRLDDTLEFKSRCLYTEDYITPFIKEDVKLDLKLLHSRVKKNENVCRLCMRLSCDHVTANDEEQFQKYFPEIALNRTESPTICSKCHVSFQNHVSFVSCCVEREEILKNYISLLGKNERKNILEGFMDYLAAPISAEQEQTCHREVDIKQESDTEMFDDSEDGLDYKEEIEATTMEKKKPHQCAVCDYSTNNITYLRTIHQLKHVNPDDEKTFACPECPLTTKYKSALRNHIKALHMGQIFTCDTCKWTTRHKISLVRHVKTHEDPVFECDNCVFRTRHAKSWESHVCRTQKAYQCDLCQLVTRSARSLRSHITYVHQRETLVHYKCEFCAFSSPYKKNFAKHSKIHNGNCQCPKCKFKTFSMYILKRHLMTHEPDKPKAKIPMEKTLACSKCDFRCVRKKTLERHELSHIANLYQCKLCSFSTNTSKRLDSHRMNHQAPRFPCSDCDYVSKTRSHLKLHRRKHENNVELYRCSKCPFKSKWKESYVTHLILHQEDPLKCPECDFHTFHRKTLCVHRKVAHSAKELPVLSCDSCEYTTTYKPCMSAHQLVHKDPSKMKMFRCSSCKFQSKYKRSLRNHIRDVHHGDAESPTNERKDSDIKPDADINKGRRKPKVYFCDQCTHSTKWRSSMHTHKKTHEVPSNEELLRCAECDFRTRYRRSLKNHISNKHEVWKMISEEDHIRIVPVK